MHHSCDLSFRVVPQMSAEALPVYTSRRSDSDRVRISLELKTSGALPGTDAIIGLMSVNFGLRSVFQPFWFVHPHYFST